MPQLTPEGLRIVNDLAQQHGFSPDAVTHMLFAMRAGNGSMAQFNHPEFAGSGQWMQGGMVMLGDMFNNSLKGRVDSLCQALGNLLLSQPGLLQNGSFQSQSQGGSGNFGQSQGSFSGGNGNNPGSGSSTLFAPDPEQEWWPKDLGSPNATGNQNSMRYAYFATARRLAVKIGNSVWVYDTQNHQIGGFSQQQGPGGNIQFSSQYGNVDLTLLPVVSRDGQAVLPPQQPSNLRESVTQEADIFSAIERLGNLREKGILTDEEFMTKKAELLSRL
jgi:hypothetical protein